jgi:hypothetical protein
MLRSVVRFHLAPPEKSWSEPRSDEWDMGGPIFVPASVPRWLLAIPVIVSLEADAAVAAVLLFRFHLEG